MEKHICFATGVDIGTYSYQIFAIFFKQECYNWWVGPRASTPQFFKLSFYCSAVLPIRVQICPFSKMLAMTKHVVSKGDGIFWFVFVCGEGTLACWGMRTSLARACPSDWRGVQQGTTLARQPQ